MLNSLFFPDSVAEHITCLLLLISLTGNSLSNAALQHLRRAIGVMQYFG
jgi:hypothetical protein